MSSLCKTHIAILYWLSILLVGCGESPQAPQPQNGAEKNTKAETENSTQPASNAINALTNPPSQPVEWQVVSFPDIGISVEMPASEESISGTRYVSNSNGIEYGINSMPLPSKAKDKLNSFKVGSIMLMYDMHARLSNARDGAARAGKLSLIDSTFRYVQGHPAVEFSGSTSAGQMIADILGIVIDKKRFVLLSTRTPVTNTERSEARRFLDNLRLNSNKEETTSEGHAISAIELIKEFDVDPEGTYEKYRDTPLLLKGSVLNHRQSGIKDWPMTEMLIADAEYVNRIVRSRADPLNKELRVPNERNKITNVVCMVTNADSWSQAGTGAKVELRGYLNEPGMGYLCKLALSNCELVKVDHAVKPVMTAEEITKRFRADLTELNSEVAGRYLVVEGRVVEFDLKTPTLSTHIFLEGTEKLTLQCVCGGRKMETPPSPGDLVRISGVFEPLHEVDKGLIVKMSRCQVIRSTSP